MCCVPYGFLRSRAKTPSCVTPLLALRKLILTDGTKYAILLFIYYYVTLFITLNFPKLTILRFVACVMIHAVCVSRVMNLDVKHNFMSVVLEHKVERLYYYQLLLSACLFYLGLYLEARPDNQNESNVVLKAYCSLHSLHHLEHYPAFPRDVDRSLGNETALVAKSMGLSEEDYNIIYRFVTAVRSVSLPLLTKGMTVIGE